MSEDTKKETESHESFQVGDRVKHPKFGEGQVIQRTGSGDQTKLVVTFAEEGEKKLMARYANLKKLHPIASEEQKAPEVKPKPVSIPPRKRSVEPEEEPELAEAAEGEGLEAAEAAEAAEEIEADEEFEFEGGEETVLDEEEKE
jgi:hypothetical protein